MRSSRILCAVVLAGSLMALFPGYSFAAFGRTYEVTITNITRGQVITPPVLFSHSEDFSLFNEGAPASPELANLAEEGATNPLVTALTGRSDVRDVVIAPGPLFPGQSVTLTIETRGRFNQLSAAGMLAVSNDAFFAIRNVPVPERGALFVDALAYDAGSEANSESCAFVPGPPCGSANAHDPTPAEGFVHVHAGIHGIGDLVPAAADWRNPVAVVVIRPGRQ